MVVEEFFWGSGLGVVYSVKNSTHSKGGSQSRCTGGLYFIGDALVPNVEEDNPEL